MAFLDETGGATVWEAGIYEWTEADPVEGGPLGIDNVPTRQLAKRTAFLKAFLDDLRNFGGWFRRQPTQTNASATLVAEGLGKLHLISAVAGAVEITLPAAGVVVGTAISFAVLPTTTQAVALKVGNGVQILSNRGGGQRQIPLFKGDRITLMYCGNIGGSTISTWFISVDNRFGLARPGFVSPYTGTTAPPRWMLCEGQILAKSEYPELYAVIGDAFKFPGAGHAGAPGVVGAAQFRIPDMRGEFMRGWDNGSEIDRSGSDPSFRQLGEWADQAIKIHNHYIDIPNSQDGGSGPYFGTASQSADTIPAVTRLNPIGGNVVPGFDINETRPRNLAFSFLIFVDTPYMGYIPVGGGPPEDISNQGG